MAREKFLEIMVPVTISDCEDGVYRTPLELQISVPASDQNTNKIYRVNSGLINSKDVYYRSTLSGVGYKYEAVVEREFPKLGEHVYIYDFTYDAERMGTAPTISAQNVTIFADKDGQGHDVTLDGYWSQECFVVFNGEKFHLKQVPSSKKTNEDARYVYDIDFVADSVVLENIYFYDIVSPFVTEKPTSQNPTFSFYGDIVDFSKRINSSLIRSGLATLQRKYVPYPLNPSQDVPYLTYEQWNMMNVDPSTLIGTGLPFSNAGEMQTFGATVYSALDADYNRYLMQYIYVNEDGVYNVEGYQCVIGNDKEGNPMTSEEKLVSFDKNTIHEALQQFHDTFGLDYYVTMERDVNGDFTGNTLIVVGDCEHDFADWDENNDDYVRDDEGIPTTESPFDYGAENELIFKEKTNTTDKIVTRITGVGSSENIPWYYPNPCPDGWIRPVFKTNGEEVEGVSVDYPTSEGDTPSENTLYEKYIKNRIGNQFSFGKIVEVVYENEYNKGSARFVDGSGGHKILNLEYFFPQKPDLGSFTRTRITFSMQYPIESNCLYFYSELVKVDGNMTWGTYDSSQTYQNPTSFQVMCENRNGVGFTPIVSNTTYKMRIVFVLSSIPFSLKFEYSGYRYGSATINYSGQTGQYIDGNGFIHQIVVVDQTAYIGEDFYQFTNLIAFAKWSDEQHWDDGDGKYYNYMTLSSAGYSTDGTISGRVSPMTRVKGKHYFDFSSDKIYKCEQELATNIHNGDYSSAYSQNPIMSVSEWVNSFLNMRIYVNDADSWYLGSKKVYLSDYGLGNPTYNGNEYYVEIGDTIEFQRMKYLTPQQNLMPEAYVKTDGERRYYDAHDYYPLQEGSADVAIGEEQIGTYVINPIYKENESDTNDKHYDFENQYVSRLPHEHIENIEDVKPSIKGQTNTVGGQTIRIDVVETFDYDETDNDEIWESSEHGSIKGEYKHPYFFAKLRPLGFNIFDLALQEDMVVSMTTGNCGACSFKIGVDENTRKNTVQIWEYDVYGGDTFETKGDVIYNAGDLRRYVDTSSLYYDTDGTSEGYVPVSKNLGIIDGGPTDYFVSQTRIFERYTYSAKLVENGYVGTMKQNGKVHFEGDIVTSGRYIESQQDTTENYVWVALMKDTDTYGVIMPSAKPNYNNPSYDVYIEPKGIQYKDRVTGNTSVLTEDEADKFVILNIKMPQIYLRRAEHELSRRLVKYMYDNNYEKFNFSIRFSRIYLAENDEVDDKLNENSVLYVMFNGHTYRQYVKHYTYKMSHEDALPDINVEMNEELSVSRNFKQQQQADMKANNMSLWSVFNSASGELQKKIERRTVGKDESVILSGDIIVSGTDTSLLEMAKEGGKGSLEWFEF